MIAADWDAMKREAEILMELFAVTPADSPEIVAIIERTQELARLGWEARALLAQTEGRTSS